MEVFYMAYNFFLIIILILLTGGQIMSDNLNLDDKKYLLKLARESIMSKLDNVPLPKIEPSQLKENLKVKTGCFVTLHKNGDLRGCIGYLEGREPLYQAVLENAQNAAFSDYRFPQVKKDEMKSIEIEITVLTQPQKLNYSGVEDLLNKLRPRIDGVILKKGYNQATFLPQVWDQLSSKEEFLMHLCMKAGLSDNEWQKGELIVLTYQAFYFDEKTVK